MIHRLPIIDRISIFLNSSTICGNNIKDSLPYKCLLQIEANAVETQQTGGKKLQPTLEPPNHFSYSVGVRVLRRTNVKSQGLRSRYQ